MEMPCLVFCCYARKDQEFLQNLKIHLKPLEREGLITIKADIDISPGTEWKTAITHHLELADIILLLISPDFIASDYSFDEEMQRAIARHEQGTARVVPVIIRPTSWHRMPFSKLQTLPKDATPISLSNNIDAAFLSVAEGIRTVVQELTTDISVNQKPEKPWWSSAQKDLLPASNQGRNDMNTKNNSNTFSIKNRGPVYGQPIGDGNINIIHITDKQKDGIRALELGEEALSNKNYSSAKKDLCVAIEEIDREQQRKEAAKAHYLYALAMLGDERPRDKGIAATEKINELLNTAIRLDPCKAYVMTTAVIRNPSLRKQANSTHITDYDEVLLKSLKGCQLDLYNQICQVFGI
jgi:TIR domain